MSAPLSAGWHPAPDGNGEQWWNGVSWSESRRARPGTGFPPPRQLQGPQSPQPPARAAGRMARTTAMAGIVTGGIGLAIGFGSIALFIAAFLNG